MRRCTQPGPARAAAWDSAPCTATPVQVALPRGAGLLDALGDWMRAEGCDGAMLTLRDVPVTALRYVLPAPSHDPAFAATYSADHVLHGPGFIRSGQMTLGWRDGASFAHFHGLFEDAGGRVACGHLRVESCVLGKGATLTGHVLHGATFEARPCGETNFTLLTPVARRGVAANAAVVKLSPNRDLHAGLAKSALAHGLPNARIHGLGSLVGAVFADGRVLEGMETEFFIDSAQLQDGVADLSVTIVDAGGRCLSGRLAPHATAVLMTVEVLLVADTAPF